MKTNLFLGVEGWLSICVAHLLSTLSSVKLNLSGKFSISNNLLFRGVTVLFPNDASISSLIRKNKGDKVSTVGPPKVEEAKNRKKMSYMQKKKLQQLSEEQNYTTVSGEVLMQRISDFKFDELQSNRGLLIALHAKSFPMGLELWNRMDHAWVLSISCFVAVFGVQWVTGLFRTISTSVLRKHQLSPVDWKLELQEQAQDSGRFLILFLFFLTFSQIVLLGWSCSITKPLASRTKLLGGQIPLFSFMIGVTAGLFTLSFSYSPLQDGEYSPSFFQRFGIEFQRSMDELAVRLLLFSKLIHPNLLGIDEESVATICKALVSTLMGAVATIFATPILETWHLMIPLFLLESKKNNTDKDSTTNQTKKLYTQFVILAIGVLPLLYISSYVLPYYFYGEEYDVSDLGYFRIACAGSFVFFITSILHFCLQKHCKDAVTEVITGPLRRKEFTFDEVQVPFRRQFQTLLPTASNLSCFPLWTLLLLTCAQFSYINHNNPCGLHIFHDIQASKVEEAQNCFMSTNKSAKLPPIECWIQSTPTYDWINQKLFDPPQYELPTTEHCCGPNPKVTTSNLLQLAPQPNFSVYSLIFKSNNGDDGNKDDIRPCSSSVALRILWETFLEQKVFTNSVLFPIIEVTGFISCAVWIWLSLPLALIYIWSLESHRRKKNQRHVQ